jgi:predicted ATPase/class 3 adenylate cyclase
MSELPTGTLTLLFSDIEGSTVLLHRLGSQWADALSEQRRIVRAAIRDHHGIEMGTEGDSFFVVFTSAHDALGAAIDAQRGLQSQRWPADADVRVRMGVHTGEPERHEDGYVGLEVHRAARIGATAHGGQIVVSAATEQLVPDLAGAEFRDLGWHRLKDLDDAVRLYDVVGPGLLRDFPPLRSLGKPAALPAAATPMIGRSAEVDAVRSMFDLQETRLVTLTGPGGAGKTRLSIAVAAALEHRFADGVYFIGLQSARDSDVMWSAIAEALDATGGAGVEPVTRVRHYLEARQALLVLDNLEQITDADHVVSALLSVATRSRALVTSRRPLHLVGEYEYPVPPLSLPHPDSTDHNAAIGSAAVEMFVRHAQMVRPGFRLTDDNSADVLALCRRLDGLPLAIELAAARSRLLGPRALLDRIDDHLGTGVTASDRPARQRTLGATIAWSYDLLEPVEQQVFRRLGVFAASADLDAVAAVAGDGSTDPLDTIGRLVDANLVHVVEAADGEPRISLLETIRTFARDRLGESGDADQVRLRHLRWCIEAANRTTGLLRGPKQMGALDQLSLIESDVREALRWSLRPAAESDNPDDAATRVEGAHELLAVMSRYWYRFGNVAEARFWQERGVATLNEADSESNMLLLHGLAISLLQQNDVERGRATFQRALEMARRLGDRNQESRELNSLAIASRQSGNNVEAMGLLEQSLALAREIGEPTREATALSNMVVVLIDMGRYAEAIAMADRAMAANEHNDDLWGVAIDRLNATAAFLEDAGPEAALDRFVAWGADIASFGDAELTINLAELGACVFAGVGQLAVAARLLGSAEGHRERMELHRSPAEQRLIDGWILRAREQATPAEWAAGLADGRETTPDDAIAAALASRLQSVDGAP